VRDSRNDPSSPAPPVRIAVYGAAGRMGERLAEACQDSERASLGPCIVREADARPGYVMPPQVDERAFDVLVEFTHQAGFEEVAEWAIRWNRPWVSGTTGLTAANQERLRTAAENIPVLWAPNMSLGIALLSRAIREAAHLLPPEWQMEIVETHHPEKLDAPSGTALALAELWQLERGGDITTGRAGRSGPRPDDEIGIHALRLPDIVGEHRVFLGGPDETLEWNHRAHDRGAFVRGALEAANWLATKKAGLFSLEDWARDRLENR